MIGTLYDSGTIPFVETLGLWGLLNTPVNPNEARPAAMQGRAAGGALRAFQPREGELRQQGLLGAIGLIRDTQNYHLLETLLTKVRLIEKTWLPFPRL